MSLSKNDIIIIIQLRIMEKFKVGDIVFLKIAENIKIVVTYAVDESFQGVYLCPLSQELKQTLKMPMAAAIKVE